VKDVPEADPPEFPIANVYSIEAPVSTLLGPDFESVRLTWVFTVVAALAQLALVQLAPGVGGEPPPVASTDA
jgi:hypothetical protein